MDPDPRMRALLAVAAAGRDLADATYELVCDLGTPSTPRDRIRAWRMLRLKALTGLDRQVLYELLAGATWEEVAEGYGLGEEEMRARFSDTLEVWRRALPPARPPGEHDSGQQYDPDPEGTAAALDSWVVRHAAGWATVGDQVVTEAMRRA